MATSSVFTPALAAGHELDGLAALVRSYTVQIGGRAGAGMGSGVVWRPDGLIVTNAMSLGVVHTVTTRRGVPRFIAADLRLAPGNSGGPLVDIHGRVMGINAMIVGGLGVAIPSTVVGRFLRDVSRSGGLSLSAPLAA